MFGSLKVVGASAPVEGVELETPQRAERPLARFAFINGGGEGVSIAPQPANHEMAKIGSIGLDGMVVVSSRALTDETLKDAETFSSADLVDQGNIRPLIPLAIDPPDHVKYRRLLDPMFAPRRVALLEEDIAARVNVLIDTFVAKGSCNFSDEFAELLPSSVFLELIGLPWEELGTLIRLRDGILRPGVLTRPPRSDQRSSARPPRTSTRTSTPCSTSELRRRATTSSPRSSPRKSRERGSRERRCSTSASCS